MQTRAATIGPQFVIRVGDLPGGTLTFYFSLGAGQKRYSRVGRLWTMYNACSPWIWRAHPPNTVLPPPKVDLVTVCAAQLVDPQFEHAALH